MALEVVIVGMLGPDLGPGAVGGDHDGAADVGVVSGLGGGRTDEEHAADEARLRSMTALAVFIVNEPESPAPLAP